MPSVTIRQGYVPGVLGRVATLHAAYYAAQHGFGVAFEAAVAKGLADFGPRLTEATNALWHGWHQGELVASIAIDGEDLGDGSAHLRWFCVDGRLQGQGVGRHLLEAALAFVDARGFPRTRLWTFEGLDVARRLYEQRGFVLEQSWRGTQWGTAVQEQRFVRPFRAHLAQ